MSSSATNPQTGAAETLAADKGKGKAAEQEQPTTATEDSSDDEMDDDTENEHEAVPTVVDDDLAEIDASNIIQSGRRTRGKQIDWQLVAANEMEEDDEEDDEDFSDKKKKGDADDSMDMDN